MTTPQELGRQFETFWAKVFGGKTTPASGAKWYSKLDVKSGAGILWSLKLTSFKSFPLTQAVLDEAFDAVDAPGGEGAIPAMGIRIGSEDYDVVVLRRDDFLRLMQEEITFVEPTKADIKRARSRVPILLREAGSTAPDN